MVKSAVIAFVLLVSLSSFAYKNPQMRACYAVGGEFIVVNAPEDQIGLCKLGLSLVGAIDILNKDAQIEVPFSLSSYKRGFQACASRNLRIFKTFEGEEIQVCHYSDGSVIDIETLASGKDSERNIELNRVLGL